MICLVSTRAKPVKKGAWTAVWVGSELQCCTKLYIREQRMHHGWMDIKQRRLLFFPASMFPCRTLSKTKHVLLLLHKSSKPSLNSGHRDKSELVHWHPPTVQRFTVNSSRWWSSDRITAYTQADDAYKNSGLTRVTLLFHINVLLKWHPRLQYKARHPNYWRNLGGHGIWQWLLSE